MFKTNKQRLPVVFLAPSFQVSGVMTLPSFFSPIIIYIKCVEGQTNSQNKKHFEELAQDSLSPSTLASLTTQIDFKINLYK